MTELKRLSIFALKAAMLLTTAVLVIASGIGVAAIMMGVM